MKVLRIAFVVGLLISLAEGEACGGGPSENSNWTCLTSGRVSVFFRPGYESLASEASDGVEAVYEEVARGVGYEGAARVRVFLPPSDEAFNRLTGAQIPDWGGGCAFPERGVIVIRASPEGSARLREVLRHELSHVFLRRVLGEKRVPRWFDEGVAMRQSGEWRMEQTLKMARAVFLGRLIPLERIGEILSFQSSKAQLAYVESYLAVLFLCELGGPDAPRQLVRAMRSGSGFEEAFAQVAGMRAEVFYEVWEQYAKKRYNLLLALIEGPWFWIGMSGLFLGIYLTKRIRTRRVVRTWEIEEAMWE